jgi:hypothetical protein
MQNGQLKIGYGEKRGLRAEKRREVARCWSRTDASDFALRP